MLSEFNRWQGHGHCEWDHRSRTPILMKVNVAGSSSEE